MPKRKSFSRKPSVKRRRSVKKRKYSKKRVTFRKASSKRRYVKKKSRFPTLNPHAVMKYPSQKWPERVMMKMRTTYRARYSPSVLTGIASATGCTQMMFLGMNNIFSPGILNGGVAGEYKFLNAMVPADGFTMMTAGLGTSVYQNWQVRGCRAVVKIHWTNNSAGTPSGCPWEWVLFPVKTSSYTVLNGLINATGDCTFAFDRAKIQQGHSRPITLTNISANSGKSTPGGTLTCFSSPSKVEAEPSYYSQSQSFGTGTITPADTNMFALAGSHTATLEGAAANQFLDFEISMTYSVLWWNRGMAQLSVEKPITPAVEAKIDEDSMDALEDFKGLSTATPTHPWVPGTPASRGSAGLEEKKAPWTCLNPSHPKVGHERVASCL